MDLRQLEQFLAVVDAGSVAIAARKLLMSQPALTISIRRLERSLGSPLFVRSNVGMTVNDFGRALEKRARVILNETDRATREIDELRGLRRGRVAIGGSPTFASVIFPDAVARFQAAFPGVRVVIVESFPDLILRAVSTGELDCVCCRIPARMHYPELAREVLLPKLRTSIVTTADDPLASRPEVVANDICERAWLLPTRSDQFRSALTDFFVKSGLQAPEPAIEVSSVFMAKSLLLRGGYLSLMSDIVIKSEIGAGILSTLRVPGFKWETDAGAVYRRGVPLMPATQKLLDIIRTVCHEVYR